LPFKEKTEARDAICELIRGDKSAHAAKWASYTAENWARPETAPCILDGILKWDEEDTVRELARAVVALRLVDSIPLLERRATEFRQDNYLQYDPRPEILRDAVFLLRMVKPDDLAPQSTN
jgi:hypothetical protein